MRAIHLGALLGAFCLHVSAKAAPVLLVSIDGLRPGDVLEADKRGLHIPNLKKLLAEGSHASGVVGVLPSFTLPSHATLVTGVSPARHGVINNLQFWPKDQSAAQSYVFASDIRVPTLWDAAHARGIVTASVGWPVSLGSPAIDHNFSVWFAPKTGQPNDAKYIRALSSLGLLDRIERDLGRSVDLSPRENAGEEGEDEIIASRIIADYRPGFITVHFGAVDEAEHAHGPGSTEANAALEGIDTLIGKLVAAQRAVHPDTVIAIVSDHGFTAVKTEINLQRAFLDAGLIKTDATGKVISWEAVPWPAGGSAAIILARPDDAALKARVATLLEQLKADPAVGIEEVYSGEEAVRRGGFPGASFGISYKLDTTGAVRPLAQELVRPAVQAGTHGHSLSHPELRSTFLITGPGIAKGRDLGLIDMRAIAPTLASLLGVALPQAEVAALDLKPR